MNFKRGVSLLMLGAGAVLAYQNLPMKAKRKIQGVVRGATKMAEDRLEDMM